MGIYEETKKHEENVRSLKVQLTENGDRDKTGTKITINGLEFGEVMFAINEVMKSMAKEVGADTADLYISIMATNKSMGVE